MIIDCHGHYTTAPKSLWDFRDNQVSAFDDPKALAALARPEISDDQIRESLESAQLKFQRERGTDITIFSPRASAMGPHLGSEQTSIDWARICNDLIARCCRLYPENFAGVCQLPQSPSAPSSAQRGGTRTLREGAWASSAATSIRILLAAISNRRR